MTLSFGGRYQSMPENRGVPKMKADIGIAQLKIHFPVAAGISLPLSMTYANASELIQEKHVRANFGITFDLDKLLLLGGAARLLKFWSPAAGTNGGWRTLSALDPSHTAHSPPSARVQPHSPARPGNLRFPPGYLHVSCWFD